LTVEFNLAEQLLPFVRFGTLESVLLVREVQKVRIVRLTLWVILVHPNSAFFVARNDRQLLVGEEKVRSGYADLVRILR
jgi:hypothetical protein